LTRYLLDANVFIQAKNLQYGFDFCPAFWDWLIEKNAAAKVVSLDKIDDELQAGADELSEWATARGNAFFLSLDDAVVPALARVSAWATSQQYRPAAINTFLSIADYWLVAFALTHGDTVVTHERPSDGVSQIKIPNACLGLGIKFMSPYEMLRRERARFILAPAPRAA
jgi:predicted nucleic acid-binding protein